MMQMKIGNPQILLVTILSILSDRVPFSSLLAFLTLEETISAILLYLASAMIASASSS